MKHPLEMTASERADRHVQIVARMSAIETKLKADIANPNKADVFPALETEWALLDTERRKIEELGM